jgi:hypothetical protein
VGKEKRDGRKRGGGEMEGSCKSLRNFEGFDNKDGCQAARLGARQHNAYKIFNHLNKSKSGTRVGLIHTMNEKQMTICVGGI